jgi:hypothetical protein
VGGGGQKERGNGGEHGGYILYPYMNIDMKPVEIV